MWETKRLKFGIIPASLAAYASSLLLFGAAGYIFGGIAGLSAAFIFSPIPVFILTFLLEPFLLNLDNNLVTLINKKTRNIDFVFKESDGFKYIFLNPFKIKLSKFEIFNLLATAEDSFSIYCSTSSGKLVKVMVNFKLSISDINIIVKNKDFYFNDLDNLMDEEIRVKTRSFILDGNDSLNNEDKLIISEIVKKHHAAFGFNVSDISISSKLQSNIGLTEGDTDLSQNAINGKVKNIKSKRFISLYSENE